MATSPNTPSPDLSGGFHAILATPFDDRDQVDTEDMAACARFYEEKGAQGVVALAVAGEGTKLDEAERRTVIREVLGAVHVPVTVGVSAPSLHLVTRRIEEALTLGARAVLLAPSAGMTPEVIFDLFMGAAAVGAPIVLQDYPQGTGVTMSVPLIRRIIEAAQGAVVAVKNEAPPTGVRTREIREATVGAPISVFGALGALAILDEMDEGASGTMTGFAFPEVLVELVRAHQGGDRERARELYEAFLPQLVFEATPVFSFQIRKEFLRLRGVMKRSALRRPCMTMDEALTRRAEELKDAFHAVWGKTHAAPSGT